ncbi:MAG: LysR family transcriptional regulator [Gammaproteobacteria bacterium]|nr:LysR family transcriptional regulator [Gammaproteobacteria bacterium]
MDTGQLTAFIAVAECSSFSKASEQLHITQSAVSKRLAALESELETKLFERFGQRIQLTEAGRILLSDAREILDKVEQMHNNSDISKAKIGGKLRIATSHHIGLYRLPRILQGFVKKYPDVQLDMHFTDSEIAYEEVGQGLFDIAIATLPQKCSKSIQTIPLWKDELVVIFSNNHPMNELKTLPLEKMATHSAILPDEDTFTRRIIDTVFKENNIEYRLAFTTNYLETIKVMVEAGLGWSVLPKIMLNDSLAYRDLPTQQPVRELGIMLHTNKVVTPTLQVFLDELLSPL